MDFRQLRYFVALAEELNFRRAAERLNISQPPLSIQIKAMEEKLGTVLFDRSRHSVSLTGAGKLLLTHARAALRDLDRAEDLVRRAARGEAGTIRMGFVGSVPMLGLFSYLVGGFRAHYPSACIDTVHMDTGRQIAALEAGEIDIGFVRPSPQFRSMAFLQLERVWTDTLRVFFPADHPLRNQGGEIDLRTLGNEAFVGIAAGSGCGVHDLIETACSMAGFMPQIAQEAHDLRTILWLVASRTGIALLPDCYDRAGVAQVISRPLCGPQIESHICMVTHRERDDPLVKRFADYARSFEPKRLD